MQSGAPFFCRFKCSAAVFSAASEVCYQLCVTLFVHPSFVFSELARNLLGTCVE